MNNQNYYAPQPPQKNTNGCSVASLVCGIIALLCLNPMYLVSITAIILGAVGVSKHDDSKGLAVTGIVLGIASIVICLTVDILITILSLGFGFFSFFI